MINQSYQGERIIGRKGTGNVTSTDTLNLPLMVELLLLSWSPAFWFGLGLLGERLPKKRLHHIYR